MVASRFKEILRQESNAPNQLRLTLSLMKEIDEADWVISDELALAKSGSQYSVLAAILGEYQSAPKKHRESIVSDILRRGLPLAHGFTSCTDLQSSLYLAPSEVRTCCKRFFVNGERRGDVVLQGVSTLRDSSLNLKEILKAKMRLIRALNQGDECACEGCPYSSFRQWGDRIPGPINYLSMEHHSVCNLRCSYCDDTYYGGARPSYDVEQTVSDLVRSELISEDTLVVWGGGEPVIDSQSDRMVQILSERSKKVRHRFLTNATRYSSVVANLMSSGQAQIVTSVDAGSEETFKVVRGRPGLAKVLENLKRYSDASEVGSLTVKYILTDANHSPDELRSFVELVDQYGLNKSTFQISADFKTEHVSEIVLNSAVFLFQALRRLNVGFVFIDDLIRQRLRGLTHLVSSFLEYGPREFVRSPDSDKGFFMLGAGQMTHLMLSDVAFRSRWRVLGVADSRAEMVAQKIAGFDVMSINELANESGAVLLSASQGVRQMHLAALENGVAESRIIRDLVL